MKRNYYLNRLFIHPLMMSTILLPMMYDRIKVNFQISKFNRAHSNQTMSVVNHRDMSDIVNFKVMSFITLSFTLCAIGITALHFKFHPKPSQFKVNRLVKCIDVLQFLSTLVGHSLCELTRNDYASKIQDSSNNKFYCGRNTDYYIVPECRDDSIRNTTTVTGNPTGQKLPNEFYYSTYYKKLIYCSETTDPNGTDPNHRLVTTGPQEDVYISSTSNNYVYQVTRKSDNTNIGNYNYMGYYQGGR